MADNNDIPPVPLPPDDAKAGAAVPPVESAPDVPPAAPAPDAAAVPPAPAAPVESAYGAPAGATPPQQPYGSPTAYGQPAYAPAPAGPSQGLSITSMVLGIVGLLLSLFGWGFLLVVGAVVTGHMAQKRQPYAKPFWLTGIITGYIGIAISVIWFIIWIAIFALAFSSGGSYY